MTTHVFIIIAWTNVFLSPTPSNAYDSFSRCPQFLAPKNGQVICDHLLGRYCTPSCDPGYVPKTRPAWAYFCNPGSGRWATYPEFYPLPWPDCVLDGSSGLTEGGISFTPSIVKSDILRTSDLTTLPSSSTSSSPSSSPSPVSNTDFDTSNKSTMDRVTEKMLPLTSPYGQLYLSETVYRSPFSNQTNLQTESSSNSFVGDSRTLVRTGNRTSSLGLTNDTVRDINYSTRVINANPSINSVNPNFTNSSKSPAMLNDKNNISISNNSFNSIQNQTFSPMANTNNLTTGRLGDTSKMKGNNVTTPLLLPNDMSRNSNVDRNSSATHNAPLTPPNDLISYASSLLQNNSKELTYQVVEEHKNNRTHKSELDMTTVRNSHYGDNKNEIDVENITIATTKTDIPIQSSEILSKSSLFRNNTKEDQISNNKTMDNDHPTKNKNETIQLITIDANVNNRDNHVNTPSIKQVGQQQQSVKAKPTKKKYDNSNTAIKKEITISNDGKITRNDDKDCGKCNVTVKEENNKDGKMVTIQISRKKLNNNPDSENTRLIKDKIANDTAKKCHNNADNIHTNVTGSLNDSKIEAERPASRSLHTSLDDVDEETRNRLDRIINAYFKQIKENENSSSKATNNRPESQQKNQMPSVPVFSAKDLQLLRKMVEARNNNNKRSDMATSKSSSLWSKMLELTSDSSKKSSLSPYTRLVSMKNLSERDPTVATMIMKKVNNIDHYRFTKKTSSLMKRFKKHEKPGQRRQYVWNGATFVTMEDPASPKSYLNSYEGLSGRSPYVWNGASFQQAPVASSESPVQSQTSQEQTAQPSQSITEEQNSLVQPKVYPEETQATLTDPTGQQYQVTSTVEAAYQQPDSQQRSEFTKKDVQSVLDIWNNGGESSHPSIENEKSRANTLAETSDNAIMINGQKYIPAPRSSQNVNEYHSNSNLPVNTNENHNSDSNSSFNSPPLYEELERDANKQVLYYWNGESYKAITHGQTLPQNTIQYTYNGASYDITPESARFIINPPTDPTPSPTENVVVTTTSAPLNNNKYSAASLTPANSIDSIHSYEEFKKAMEAARENGNSLMVSSNNYLTQNGPSRQQQNNLNSFHSAFSQGEEEVGRNNDDVYSRKIKPLSAQVESILQTHYPSNPYSLTSTTSPPLATTGMKFSWQEQPTSSSIANTDDKSGSSKYRLKSLQSLENYLTGLKEKIVTDNSKQFPTATSQLKQNPFLPPLESSVTKEMPFSKQDNDKTAWNSIRPIAEGRQYPYVTTENKPENTPTKNPYLPTDNKNSGTVPDFIHPSISTEQNPFTEDQVDLEAVISNDLNIRKEINTLSNMFGQGESDSRDLDRLSTSSFYKELTGSETSLDKELENRFSENIPQRSDMQTPRKSEDMWKGRNNDSYSNTLIKDFESTAKTQPLVSQELKSQLNPIKTDDNKVDLRDLREKQEAFMEVLKSLETEVGTRNSKDKMEGGQSNALSQTLRHAYAATLSPSDASRADRTTADASKAERTANSKDFTYARNPFFRMNEPSKSILQSGYADKRLNQPTLNKDEIHDLLKITKLAELSAEKKHGLARPIKKNDIHSRSKTLIKDPRFKRLLKVIVHSKKSNRFLDYLKRSYNEALKRTLLPSRMKYNKYLKKLFELWNKKKELLTKRSVSQQQKKNRHPG